MLYSRSEIVELVRAQPKELQATLISLIWFASKGNPSEQNGDRYGLLQLDTNQLKFHNLPSDPAALLDPDRNIKLGAQLLERIGLVEFAGRNLAPQLPAIISLAAWLDSEPSQSHIVSNP